LHKITHPRRNIKKAAGETRARQRIQVEQSFMKNITVAVPETTYLKARVWAARHETSVSAVVAFLLQTLPESRRAAARFPRPAQTEAPRPLSPTQSPWLPASAVKL
jgi:hypothetical protein